MASSWELGSLPFQLRLTTCIILGMLHNPVTSVSLPAGGNTINSKGTVISCDIRTPQSVFVRFCLTLLTVNVMLTWASLSISSFRSRQLWMTSDAIFVKRCEHPLPHFQVTIWKKKAWGGAALPRELDCSKSSQGLGFECLIVFF